jgi:hypothetical protein
MYDILVVFVHLIVTVFRVIKPGGLRAVVAESVLTRHQILILNRSRKRARSLHVSDRIIAGLCTLLMRPSRVLRCGMVLKPSTLEGLSLLGVAVEIAFLRRARGLHLHQPFEDGGRIPDSLPSHGDGNFPPISDLVRFRQVAEIGRFRPPDAQSRRNVARTWPNSFSTRWADSVALMNSR